MGIASWRVRAALQEYAGASDLPSSGILAISRGGVVADRPDAWSLNEVGVTDAVMAALWRHAPENMTYAISSGAENSVFGGDLAIVGSQTIRIYQAKLVQRVDYSSREYVLKSRLEDKHIRLLNTSTFSWKGSTYHKSGYLALYQRELPVLDGVIVPKRSAWWLQAAVSLNAPHLGGVYYWDMMEKGRGPAARRASARGIMAAPVPSPAGNRGVASVPLDDSWPWEYGVADPKGSPSPATSPISGATAGGDSWPQGSAEKPLEPGNAIPPKPVKPLEKNELPIEGRREFARNLLVSMYEDAPASLMVVFVDR